MYTAVLVDDEELSLSELGFILEEFPDIKVLNSFTDPFDALKGIKKIKPDIVFLDISMPCMNGMEIAQGLLNSGAEPWFVFVTAHNDYALKAFDVEAVDYIIKPFSLRRIEKALERIRKRSKDRSVIHTPPDFNWIPVEDRGSIKLLNIDEICYCSVEDKRTYVNTVKNRYPTEPTLAKIEERFRHKSLFRCHKSFIVNLDFVEKIIPMFNQNFIIRLKGFKEEIPVSRHYAKKLKLLLGV